MRSVLNKIIPVALSLLVLITGTITWNGKQAFAAAEASLTIVNAGFEEPVVNGAIPGWRQIYGKSGGFTVDDSIAFEGSHSVKMVDPSAIDNYGLLSNKIAIRGGDLIKVSAQTYITQGTPGMYLYFYDSAGKTIQTYSKGFDTAPKGQWTTVGLEGLTPAGAVQMDILLYSGGGNITTANTDLITATAIPQNAASDNFLNPGFEQPVVNGAIPGWRQTIGSGGIQVVNTTAFEGKSSVRFQDTSTSDALGLLSNRIAVTGGKMYKISAQLYMDSGTNGMFLYFYDNTGKQIKAYSRGFDGLPKTQWATASLEGLSPADAVSMEVLLYSGAGNTGTGYFDNLRFSEDVQLDIAFGNPINRGEVVKVAQTPEAVFGENSKGEQFISFVINGTPATFYAADAVTGQIVFSQKLTGIDTVWALAKGSDGNIYFSGTSTGVLQRYNPNERKIEDLGKNPTLDVFVWQLKASRDGKIYGGTYPGGKLFEYDIASGTFKNYGTMVEGEDYVRGVGVSDDYVYAGVGARTYLIQINRKTGEKRDIDIPGRRDTGFINTVEFVGGKALARAASDKYHVIDEKTGQYERTITQLYADFSPPSPYHPELFYYKKGADLYAYNWTTDTAQIIEGVSGLGESTSPIVFDWVTPKSGEKAGKTVLAFMMGATAEYYLFDPDDLWMQRYTLGVEENGVNLITLLTGPDGKIYNGGIYRGISVYNPETHQIEMAESRVPQAEGIGFMNGKVYFGTYSGAVMYVYDPTQPLQFSYDSSGNPGLLYDIEEYQDRPSVMTSGDNRLFIGSKPGYGELGGALTIYDAMSGKWDVHRNVVQDQSVIGLAYRNGKLYGSTQVWGGLGIDPTAEEAKIFVWDVEKGQKIEEFTPKIPGIDRKVKSIGTLTFGPDGLLWGATEGAVFALNPDTYDVVKSKVFYDFYATYPIFLHFGDDGLLYTTIARTLTVIDPNTFAYKMIRDNVHIMTLAPDGSIYYVYGSGLYQLPVPLKSVSLTADQVELKKGQASQLHVTGTLRNDKNANLSEAEIQYFSSDPATVSVNNSVMTAHKVGQAQVWARVTLNGVTVETAKIDVSIPVALEGVTVSVYSTELMRSQTIKLNVTGLTNTGEPADLTGASIEFLSSSPQTVAVQDGVATAYNVGTAEIRTKVTLNGTEVWSDPVTLTVTTNLGWLQQLVDFYEADGQLGHPLAAQLSNSLKQAEKFLAKDKDQASKHLDDFLKHLHNDAMSKAVTETVKKNLDSDVKAFLQTLNIE
ncbi:hypothetical protein J31TS4_35300 [Paenibacillus sp. J31TS4]|uniref:FIMAH domain-containing protein n=1 Tax=Paenibacillus sp. J31TS4 TaxID=2807195 RepID=UPI001B001808|nr:Ig-like domain-containing protein [Paenibacillus sp. J31TS4]GIP40250.1 hypothetical protein J31TS4_35300 [Paenibacillus sp. J31TS4]